MATKRALIMAGGTGGHIFPGLALAEKLTQHNWHVEWMGTADRMEAEIVPKHDLAIHFIDIKGIRGNGLLRKLALPFTLLRAFYQARRILKAFKPSVVIGFGGYASGPGGLAAKSLNIPLVIHEQNAVLGMTNRWLSKIANHTFLAFELAGNDTPSNAQVVGNPVREAIVSLGSESKREFNADHDFSKAPLNVLVIGGSLGAQVFNQELPAIFAGVANESKVSIRHQCGKNNQAEVLARYQKCQTQAVSEHIAGMAVVVDEFIDNMTTALRWCDLVVCRAGALTVSELAASGNVGIFVPLPYAVDDHQTANAQWLVKQEAAVIIPQSDLQKLHAVLGDFLKTPEEINKLQNNAKLVSKSAATQALFALCQKLEISN